jgi:D-xylose transport system permease protein
MTAEVRTDTVPREAVGARLRGLLASTEIDSRLLGMVVALLVIWIGFDIQSGGGFLTARNLWNLSVQSAAIAIMATGMVLIIVSRNIDLSVGSLLGFLGYTMAMLQTEWIPNTFDLGLGRWYTWVLTLAFGIALGAAIGGAQGFIVAYIEVPSFIVTLGGILIWRALIFEYEDGSTLGPMDRNFKLLGGGPRGSLGEWRSWLLGGIACALIAFGIVMARRRRQRYHFAVRPLPVEVGVGVIGCAVVLGAVWVANSYPWPKGLATQYAERHGIVEPEGGLKIPTGVAYPVVILICVAIVVTYLARRRRFGRYVYAIGGNPEAAELSGVNVRRTVMMTFVLMGALCAISAAVVTARLDSAVTGLGIANELDVIAAAVLGGTSLAGGIGTIPGAILGAVVMQSLRSGMSLLGYSSTRQDVYIGIVLIVAVGLDAKLRKRST